MVEILSYCPCFSFSYRQH